MNQMVGIVLERGRRKEEKGEEGSDPTLREILWSPLDSATSVATSGRQVRPLHLYIYIYGDCTEYLSIRSLGFNYTLFVIQADHRITSRSTPCSSSFLLAPHRSRLPSICG